MGRIVLQVSKQAKLEDFLIKDAGVSKRLISRLKRTENGITRNGSLIRTIDTVNTGDIVILQFQDTKILEPNFRLCVPIAFENENLVVFDKPVGMPVHPSIKHQGDTLGNFFAAKYPAGLQTGSSQIAAPPHWHKRRTGGKLYKLLQKRESGRRRAPASLVGPYRIAVRFTQSASHRRS